MTIAIRMYEVKYIGKIIMTICLHSQQKKGVVLDLVFFTVMIYFWCTHHKQDAAGILNRTRESNDNYNVHCTKVTSPGFYTSRYN